MKIADHVIVSLPEHVFHHGTEVQLTGKIACEVRDPKTGKIAWVRSLDESAKPAAKPQPKVAAQVVQPVKQAKPRSRTRKPAAKKATAK